MKKLLFVFIIAVLTACGSAYNDSLKQIQLGMTQEQVVSLMGKKYTSTADSNGNPKLEYVDRYKNHWFFQFKDDKLVEWYKKTE